MCAIGNPPSDFGFWIADFGLAKMALKIESDVLILSIQNPKSKI
jgi:hypothetical protein